MNPKKKSKELKRISRENLNGRYRLSMSVFLTVTLINLFSDLPFTYLLGNVYATKVQTVITPTDISEHTSYIMPSL